MEGQHQVNYVHVGFSTTRELRDIAHVFRTSTAFVSPIVCVVIFVDDVSEILKKGRSSTNAEANELLIQRLQERARPGWFQGFIHALEENGKHRAYSIWWK